MAGKGRREESFYRGGDSADGLYAAYYPYVYVWKKGAHVDDEEKFDESDLSLLFVVSSLKVFCKTYRHARDRNDVLNNNSESHEKLISTLSFSECHHIPSAVSAIRGPFRIICILYPSTPSNP